MTTTYETEVIINGEVKRASVSIEGAVLTIRVAREKGQHGDTEIVLPCTIGTSAMTSEQPGPTIFRAVFLKQILSSMADNALSDAWLGRELFLPFTPHKNMIFTDPDGWHTKAVDVQWDGEMFIVYTRRDTEIHDKKMGGRSFRDMQFIIDDWTDQGWLFLGHDIHPPISDPNLWNREEEDTDEG